MHECYLLATFDIKTTKKCAMGKSLHAFSVNPLVGMFVYLLGFQG